MKQTLLFLIFISGFNQNRANAVTNTQIQNLGVYYVSAVSGLNFRAQPKGKILGKFPLNTRLVVSEKTNIFQNIIDNEKAIEGEWLGVKHNNTTVYVFSGFLSPYYSYADFKLYVATPYQKLNNAMTVGFVNVSETFFADNNNTTSSIFPKNELGNDTIRFNQNQRLKILQQTKITEKDTLFLHNLQTDAISKFNIRDLPIMACVSPYDRGDAYLAPINYQIGFSLGTKYTLKGETFAFIGASNPFETGKLKAIDWQKIDATIFSEKFVTETISETRSHWLSTYSPAETYKYTNDNHRYYIQNLTKNDEFKHRYLIVEDAKTGAILFEDVHINSEDQYITPIDSETKNEYNTQWTGAVFKDQPAIVYGFTNHSFGCPVIKFIDPNTLEIPVRCDNRH